MKHNNFATYKPGTFAVDVSNLTPAIPLFEPKDMPAFIHEYCHYIQDITQISSIFGFSLWIRDVVMLTQILSKETGKTIKIPLRRDENGQPINKFRKYYNLYCGDPNEVHEINYTEHRSFERKIEEKDIPLDGDIRKFAVNTIKLEGRNNPLFFGLIVLQEIQAYYAQRHAEHNSGKISFSICTDDLPSFPYKFGDFLFDFYKISIDLPAKFLLVDLCLDTVQAPTVFLDVLEILKGRKVSLEDGGIESLIFLVKETAQRRGYSREIALGQILPDLKMWAGGEGRKHLTDALAWYADHVEATYELKNKNNINEIMFSRAFIGNWDDIAKLFSVLPPPIYIKDNNLLGTTSFDSAEASQLYQRDYESATTFWAHRVLYDLLTAESIDQINERSNCPLYENCIIKTELAEEYTCKTAPWQIIKGRKQSPCLYGMAAHSFGLWQNDLEIG